MDHLKRALCGVRLGLRFYLKQGLGVKSFGAWAFGIPGCTYKAYKTARICSGLQEIQGRKMLNMFRDLASPAELEMPQLTSSWD